MHRYPASSDEQARVQPARPRALAVVPLLALAFAAAFVLEAPAPSHAASFSFTAAETSKKTAQRPKKAKPAADTPFGREGDARKATRTIKIETSDAMRYFPDHVTVKKGQTVRFNIRNSGELPHEMVLGTMDDLKKDAQLVRKNSDVERDEPNVAHVEPGQTGRIVWQFTRAGEFYYGCLVPGHFDAGMIGTIVVR